MEVIDDDSAEAWSVNLIAEVLSIHESIARGLKKY